MENVSRYITLLNAAKKVCGVTKGSTRMDRKSWMWSEKVKEAVKDKKDKFRKWKNSKTEADKIKYREARSQTKKEVAIEINKNRGEWVKKIEADGKNGRLFRIARSIASTRVDVGKMKQIKRVN